MVLVLNKLDHCSIVENNLHLLNIVQVQDLGNLLPLYRLIVKGSIRWNQNKIYWRKSGRRNKEIIWLFYIAKHRILIRKMGIISWILKDSSKKLQSKILYWGELKKRRVSYLGKLMMTILLWK
jgi:hypothetical protein